MTSRKPLAKVGDERLTVRAIRYSDSLWRRFTDAALARGRSDISAFVRECSIAGLEFLEMQAAFGSDRRRTGNTA